MSGGGGDGVGLAMHVVILDFIFFDGEEGAEPDVEGELLPWVILFDLFE